MRLLFWKKKKKKEIDLTIPKDNTFNFTLIELYFGYKHTESSDGIISDKTWKDLDMDEIFMFSDRTLSAPGQQYLYNRLREIPDDPGNQSKVQEQFISFFKKTPKALKVVKKNLHKLAKDKNALISTLIFEQISDRSKFVNVLRFFSFASFVSLILSPYFIEAFIVFIAVLMVNLVLHYRNKFLLHDFTSSIPRLFKMNNIAYSLFNKLPVNLKCDETIKGIVRIRKIRNRAQLFKLENFIESDFGNIFWFMVEIIKACFLLEPLIMNSILKYIEKNRQSVQEVFDFIGILDASISIMSLRDGLDNYCIPEFVSINKYLKAKGIYHPLINECITNDIGVHGNSILITGSNMTGKTTFIRQVGINCITAQTINTCFSKEFKIPGLNIYSAIRISDDLLNDRSYYLEEVMTIKEMIEKSEQGKPCLFLLDEIFKGTNTAERISAGKAVLSYLNNGNNLVFVSTHDIELTELLSNEYELFHFREIITGSKIDFDYKIREGSLYTRNAINILEINKYPSAIIEEARKLAKQF